MKTFRRKEMFLDRNDINTFDIIPAKYLTEITKAALKSYLPEDLFMEGFSTSDLKDEAVIVTRTNFGCGSQREHAPWALEVNDINVVIAESFARIFRQNMATCGMFAIDQPKDVIDYLFETYAIQKVTKSINVEDSSIMIITGEKNEKIKFKISGFDKTLIKEEGWVGFAEKHD